MKNQDFTKKRYSPQLKRGLHPAIVQRLRQDFPRIGGERILNLCADIIIEVIDANLVRKESLEHGQILWNAIDITHQPHRGQRAENTRMIPVILTLVHPDDALMVIEKRGTMTDIKIRRMIRLSYEAHEQGALLSNVDLSLLLGMSDSVVSSAIVAHEKENSEIIPRRTTLHDVGSGVTHKTIICRKRHLEGKDPGQVAKETYHTQQSVDNYLGQYDRVRHCRKENMSINQTAHILGCSLELVKEYWVIDDEINEARTLETNKEKK